MGTDAGLYICNIPHHPLVFLHLSGDKVTQLNQIQTNGSFFPGFDIWSVEVNREDTAIWINDFKNGGIFKVDINNNSPNKIGQWLDNIKIICIVIDEDRNNAWVGTSELGLYLSKLFG